MSETNSASAEPEKEEIEKLDQSEQPNQPSASRFWIIVVVIAMVAFGAYAVKTIIDDHNRNPNIATENLSRNDIAQEFAPQEENQDHNQDTSPDQPAPAEQQPNSTPQGHTPDLRGPAAVLGTETHTESPPAQPQFKPYRNDGLGFETTVPFDANVTANNNEITAVSTTQGGIYWTVTVYPNTAETFDSIEAQLRSSPSVTSLFRTTVGGIAALRFTSPNLDGGTGYAIIHNNRLYYLIGGFNNTTLLTSFKFF